MKKNLYTFLVVCLVSISISAQNAEKTIVAELNSSKGGQGNIKVILDDAIRDKLAVRLAHSTDTTKMLGALDPSADFVEVRGFKIQAFSGNNQAKSRREAESKQTQIKNAYPELETKVTFESPFWRLRVGNFLTREDAQTVLNEMKKTFPAFSREMTIVSATVKRPTQ